MPLLNRRQKAGVRRFLGVPASDFGGRQEAPTIAAAAAPGKAPARQAHRHPPPPAGALPKARAAPILAAMSDSSQADAAAAPAETRPNTFFCIDGHTRGNPVRLEIGGAHV